LNATPLKLPDQRFYRLWVVEDHSPLQLEPSGQPLELAGTLWFFPKRFKPGIPHQSVEGFTFWFDDVFIKHNPILRAANGPWIIRKPLIVPSSGTFEIIRQICRDHFLYLSDAKMRQHPLAYAAATLLLLHLSETLQAPFEPPASKKVHPTLSGFFELLNLHYCTRHQPNFYADQLHITIATLRRHCQEAFAQSPSELIQQKLVDEAKRLLLDTGRSVKEIAYDLGFEDESYFIRFFRQHALLPPRAFRRTFLPD
jgi:AraC-like DNA-binding protein